ncbi:MAG TPA: hypothetical protein VFN50_07630 [Acidimicrobiales bacterium]|nr:hypothetical protein [Acidimicrobiales bacterium]
MSGRSAAGERAASAGEPAWRRPTRGEHRIQMAVAVLVAIALQFALPSRFAIGPFFLMPALEAAILVGLVVVDPGRMVRRSTAIRAVTLLLVAAISLANAVSLALLLHGLVNGTIGNKPGPLLASGAAIWGTNVIAFGFWYWEFDRGGPASRARGLHPYPDLMFPQQSTPQLAEPDWEPEFPDYLYTSFTNAAAFSPTDTMPLSRWAKMAFLLQSAISLVTAALVVARVANVFH